MDDNLPEKADREHKLIQNLALCDTIQEAALLSGYSESMAKSNIYRIVKRPDFQKKLREYYLTNNSTLLPKIIKAESKLVDIVLNDPEKLSKHNNTIKQMKQAAGILEPDTAPKQQVINIKNIRELSIQLQQKRLTENEGATEGEIINSTN